MDGKKYGFVLGQEKKPGTFSFTFWQINWEIICHHCSFLKYMCLPGDM